MDISKHSSVEDAELAMRMMLMQLMDALVANPEQSSVEIVRRDDATTFVIVASSEDLKQLTQSNARTVNSLQMIVNAVGLKSQRRFVLAFRDETSPDPGPSSGECEPPSHRLEGPRDKTKRPAS